MKQTLKAGSLFVLLVSMVFSISIHFDYEERYKVISSDAEGYYQYLPAVFIKKDITDQPYSYYMEDGRLFNKYTCGVALLEMPFFLGAHLYTRLTESEAADGYSQNYEYALQLSAAFYLVAGMFCLYYFLRRYFPAWAIVISLLAIYQGTNMLYYTNGEAGMSHVYSFFIFSAFICFTPHFLEFKGIKFTLVTGLLLGIAVLLRPTNIILGFFILFYDVYNFRELRDRFMLLLGRWWHFAIIAVIGVLVFIPQMYYWNKMLGKLFVNSYRYDVAVTGFINWRNPKILQVLAGHRSGWLLYAPVMILSLIGLVWIFIKHAYHSRGLMIIFLILLYLSGSWSAYTFGSAYGYRPFIELSAFLSIPFVFMMWKIFRSNSIVLKALLVLFIANCIFLNYRLIELYDASWDGLWWKWENYFHTIKQAYYIEPS